MTQRVKSCDGSCVLGRVALAISGALFIQNGAAVPDSKRREGMVAKSVNNFGEVGHVTRERGRIAVVIHYLESGAGAGKSCVEPSVADAACNDEVAVISSGVEDAANNADGEVEKIGVGPDMKVAGNRAGGDAHVAIADSSNPVGKHGCQFSDKSVRNAPCYTGATIGKDDAVTERRVDCVRAYVVDASVVAVPLQDVIIVASSQDKMKGRLAVACKRNNAARCGVNNGESAAYAGGSLSRASSIQEDAPCLTWVVGERIVSGHD